MLPASALGTPCFGGETPAPHPPVLTTSGQTLGGSHVLPLLTTLQAAAGSLGLRGGDVGEAMAGSPTASFNPQPASPIPLPSWQPHHHVLRISSRVPVVMAVRSPWPMAAFQWHSYRVLTVCKPSASMETGGSTAWGRTGLRAERGQWWERGRGAWAGGCSASGQAPRAPWLRSVWLPAEPAFFLPQPSLA